MKGGHRRKHRVWVIVLIVVAVVAAIRLALPYVILRYANRSLSEMEGYNGRIRDIDLSIIRGAYTIDSIYINKIDSPSAQEIPFLAASTVDLSVEWRSLFKGSLVGEIVVEDGMMRFTREKVEPKDVQKDSSDFSETLRDFMPLKINRLEFKNSRLQYIDQTSKPSVNVTMTDVDLIARNLRNSYDSADVLPARVDAHATVYDGRLDMEVKLNPLSEAPTFDMNAEWRHTNLVKLNDFFQAYAKVDVNKGSFGLYTEIAAKNGNFTGYVKPLLEDIDVVGKEDRDDNLLRKAWEGVAGAVTEVFENQPKERFATKIPLKGQLDDPRANIFFAIAQVLENAFINALQPSIDQQINLTTVDKEQEEKGFLEKVFGKDDRRDKNKDKSRKSTRRKNGKDRG